MSAPETPENPPMSRLAQGPVSRQVASGGGTPDVDTRPHTPADPSGDVVRHYVDTHAGTRFDGPAWLSDLREAALHTFARVGMPAPRAEAWRYTRHKAASQAKFAPQVATRAVPHDRVRGFAFGEHASAEIVVIDGRMRPELSRLDGLPAGVQVLDLIEAADVHAELLRPRLARAADPEKNPFVALNTAHLGGGVYVGVDAGVRLDLPVHVMHVSTGEASGSSGGDLPPVVFPRLLIDVAAGASVSIVQTYSGPEHVTYFTCGVTEIFADDDAHVDHYKLNAEGRSAVHVATMEVRLGAKTVFVDHACTIGARMTRNDLNVHLDGPGADATLNGVVVLDGDQHCDNHTLLDHQYPDCPSYELYKHVLDDKASGVFKGQIFVHRRAQKTDAKQNSRSLLLSDEAEMNSQPALEIYADDVKCTHGSTTGPLDEGAVFYLNSRGVSTEVARRLLTYAFAADVTRRIKVQPVRQRVEDYMARQHGLPTDFRIQDLAEATEDVVF